MKILRSIRGSISLSALWRPRLDITLFINLGRRISPLCDRCIVAGGFLFGMAEVMLKELVGGVHKVNPKLQGSDQDEM